MDTPMALPRGASFKEFFNYSNDLNNFIDIAAVLLKSIALRGGVGRAQISHGKISDITGLYSKGIREQIEFNNANILGRNNNVMFINPLIGSSIINCVKLKGPSGPLLLIDKSVVSNSEKEKLLHYNEDGYDVYGVNWLSYNNKDCTRILKKLNLIDSSLLSIFRKYLDENSVHPKWNKEAENLL